MGSSEQPNKTSQQLFLQTSSKLKRRARAAESKNAFLQTRSFFETRPPGLSPAASHFRRSPPSPPCPPSHRSDWVTSYKVMVSNDSHTWRTLRNGSEDMVSVSCGIYMQTGRDGPCVQPAWAGFASQRLVSRVFERLEPHGDAAPPPVQLPTKIYTSCLFSPGLIMCAAAVHPDRSHSRWRGLIAARFENIVSVFVFSRRRVKL